MKSRICSKIFVLLACFTLLLLSHSAIAGTTERVSVSSAGSQANNDSSIPSISADGRYVAFQSYASTLVSGDTNGYQDVFVRDLETGTTERVSVSSAGVQGNNSSTSPSISEDGRYVAFQSSANNLVAGDSNAKSDIFVRDRETGTTERVSVSSAGVEGNDNSSAPSISADGRYVAFYSGANNLVAGDANGYLDVFVRDRETNTTELVSVSTAGVQGNSTSLIPSISADGRYVAFYSSASNLVAGDTNDYLDVFVRDLETGITERVSVSSEGVEGNDYSSYLSINADGRYVAFQSNANNLVAGDTNGYLDVFVRDRETNTTELVSVSTAGTQGNSASVKPSISADGRHVAFYSYANNLVSGDTNDYLDIFVRDLETGTTERVSVSSAGAQGNNSSSYPSISADGRYVAFLSDANNLVSGDTNVRNDVFVRDRVDPPINASLAPNSGNIVTERRTTLTSVYTDINGANNINTCYLLVNNSFSMTAGYLFYNVAKNRLYLRPTDSTTLIGGYAPGKGMVIDNGFLILNCAQSTVQKVGNTLTINWSVTFKPSFAGSTCNAWMRVTNKSGLVDPWEQMGTFSMLVNPTPKNESITPNSGTITIDAPTAISSVYSDPAGYANIRSCYMMMNTGATTSGAGYLFYDPVKNKLYLRETGSSTIKGGYAPGSANIIDNGSIVLNCADTTVNKVGNNITINWNIALKTYFAGNPCTASMQVTNKTGQSDPWEQMGLFSVN